MKNIFTFLNKHIALPHLNNKGAHNILKLKFAIQNGINLPYYAFERRFLQIMISFKVNFYQLKHFINVALNILNVNIEKIIIKLQTLTNIHELGLQEDCMKRGGVGGGLHDGAGGALTALRKPDPSDNSCLLRRIDIAR